MIAEGVETEAQMSFLREHRCDEIQGYYFSKPILADAAASILSDQTCLTHSTIPADKNFGGVGKHCDVSTGVG